jgi:hypothetical protein
VLAVDPGPAAKLLYAEMGGLAAAVAAARPPLWQAGALALIMLAADPLFNWELGVAYGDLGATLFALLAFAALRSTGREAALRRTPETARHALRLCGVFAGACVATRYTAAAVPLTIVGLLWLSRSRGARAARLDGGGGVERARPLALAGANLVLTGNPAAPALQGSSTAGPGVLRRKGDGTGRWLSCWWPEPRRGRPPDAARQPHARARALARLSVRLPPGPALRGRPSRDAGAGRRPALGGAALPAVGVMTLAWFFTSQEPRYLVLALGLAAAAAGVGLHEMLRGCAAWRPPLLALLAGAVPLAALAHTQIATLARLPYVYGYALGRLSVDGFRAQDPALVVADRLPRP